MKYLMKFTLISLFLVGCGSFSQVVTSQVEPQYNCYSLPSSMLWVNCFDDDIQGVFESVDFEWTLEGTSENYYAVTHIAHTRRGLYILTVYRSDLPIGVIPHEISHVADALELETEVRAKFIEAYTNVTTYQALKDGVDLYMPIGKEKIYLDFKN